MSLIVGISGKAQTGKDTIARMCSNILIEKGYTTSFYSFAYRLKRAAMLIFNLSEEDVFTSKGKKKVLPHFNNITVREILQKFGTEVCRNIHKDIWVWNTMNDIEKGTTDVAFITDMRFSNEYKVIKDSGGIVMRTHRDVQIDETSHASENGLDNISYEWNFQSIANNLVDLKNNAVFFVYNHILKGLKNEND